MLTIESLLFIYCSCNRFKDITETEISLIQCIVNSGSQFYLAVCGYVYNNVAVYINKSGVRCPTGKKTTFNFFILRILKPSLKHAACMNCIFNSMHVI